MAAALAIAFLIACEDAADTAPAAQSNVPTPLVEGFRSHQPIDEVEGALRRAGKRITVVEDGTSGAAHSKARPALSVRIVRAAPFELWGIEGDLRLEFIDGVLWSTWFYPSDPIKFAAEAKKRSLGAEPRRPLRLEGTTELRSDVDYAGARYWAWEDINLRKKLDQWIKRNA